MAIEQRRPAPGLIHHTDQGVVYATALYRAILKQQGMIASMSRKGNCLENAVAESFFSNLKNELTWHHNFQTRAEARAAVLDYIELFSNRGRPHSALGPGVPDPPANLSVSLSKSRHRLDDFRSVQAEAILGGLHREYSLARA